jgi:imidazolonepropionase-like amidohydrolase
MSRHITFSNNVLAQPKGEDIIICSLGLAGFLGGSNGLHVSPPIGIGDTGLRADFFNKCGASSANQRRGHAVQAEKGVWLSLQPLPEDLRLGFPVGSVQRAKADEVWPGIARTYELAKKYNIKTAWGTDVLFSRALAQQQGAILASLVRWYTPAEALVMATSTNAELLALSGKRNPYPGKLGVVEQGALADLLLVDGNPLDNISMIADPANFKIIMKDGTIYKNTLTK